MQKMREKEANELIDKLRDLANDTEVDMFCVASLNAYFEESADAIQTLLEEIQQYRAIGTVEEVKQLKENAFTGNEMAIIASNLIVLRDYQSIGTLDQCREAVERMKPKKVVMRYGCTYRCPPDCGGEEYDEYGDVPHCPSCDRVLHSLDDICKCGQRIVRE